VCTDQRVFSRTRGKVGTCLVSFHFLVALQIDDKDDEAEDKNKDDADVGD